MDMMEGLAGTLAGMQEDAGVALKMGGGFVLGLGIARAVDVAISETEFAKTPGNEWVKWAVPAVPVLAGLALFSKARDKYPALAGSNGLGMIGYGLARYTKLALNKMSEGQPADSVVNKMNAYLSLGAVDNYESSLINGLGYMDMSVNRYMPRGEGFRPPRFAYNPMDGLGYNDTRSHGAPVMVETISGAPMTATQISGAPTSVTTLQGLSAVLM